MVTVVWLNDFQCHHQVSSMTATGNGCLKQDKENNEPNPDLAPLKANHIGLSMHKEMNSTISSSLFPLKQYHESQGLEQVLTSCITSTL